MTDYTIDEQAPRYDEAEAFPQRDITDLPGLNWLFAWLANPVHYLFLLASLLPMAFTLAYTYDKVANVPIWDEWVSYAEQAIDANEGDFSPRGLLVQRNEHRLLMGHTVNWFFATFTDWNIRLGIHMSVALSAVIWLLLVVIFYQQEPQWALFGMVPFALLVFALRKELLYQSINYVGEHLSVTLFLTGTLAVMLLPRGWLALSILMAVTIPITYTMLWGTIYWVAGLMVLLMLGYRNPLQIGAWIFASVVFISLYFVGYHFDVLGADGDGQGAGFFTDLPVIMEYYVTYLGGLFVPQLAQYVGLAGFIGIITLVFLIWNIGYLLWMERDMRYLAPWVPMMVVSLGFGGLIAIGRGHTFNEGSTGPLWDRYVALTIYMWIGLVAIGIMSTRRAWHSDGLAHRALVYGNITLAVLLFGLHLNTTYITFNKPAYITDAEQKCVANYPITRNDLCINRIFVNDTPLDFVTANIDRMAELGLAVFAEEGVPDYHDVMPLREIQPRVLLESSQAVEYRHRHLPANERGWVLFQHADSMAEFDLSLPDDVSRLELRTAIWVDTANLGDTSIPEPQDGVLFRVFVRDATGRTLRIVEAEADPNAHDTPRGVRVTLDQFIGQDVTLVLQTDSQSNPFYDWSMWRDPVIISYE